MTGTNNHIYSDDLVLGKVVQVYEDLEGRNVYRFRISAKIYGCKIKRGYQVEDNGKEGHANIYWYLS